MKCGILNKRKNKIMPRRLSLTYYFVSQENNVRLTLFSAVSGDSMKTLVQQYVRGWISRNRQIYMDLANYDAHRRHLSLSTWANIVGTEGVHALPPPSRRVDDFKIVNPLAHVMRPELAHGAVKHTLNYINLSTQNLILFKIANHYDQDSAIGFVSRIIQEHLDRNWDSLYQPQIDFENFENWEKYNGHNN
jgi:hypothetical protein